MSQGANILLVDDEPGMLRYIRTLLEVDDYKVETASTGEEALARVQKGLEPDLVLLDVLMPGIDGLETLEQLRQVKPGLKVVMLSCVNDTRKVVQAMRLGAHDYLTKPFQKAELDAVIDQCLGSNQQAYGGEVEELCDDVFFVAASPAMRKIRSQAALVANVDIPVLLLGESGTGKEVLARLVHKLSPRAHRTFLKVNCAAVPADLLESELFGYEAGAFTGATHPKPGKFALCNKGTILHDEIGEMSPLLQAKLLQVLQDGTFSRLGGRTTIAADFRLLAATNVRVEQAMQSGALREDLYYRLSTFTVNIPPLRERKEEIAPLCRQFMREFSRKYSHPSAHFSARLLRACMRYRWPGNLRELGNFVKRHMVLQDENLAIAELEAKMTGATVPIEPPPELPQGDPEGLKSMVQRLKRSAEPKVIEEVLSANDWNCKEAAAKLKISYKALLYKIKEYQLTPLDSNGTARSARGANGRH